MSRHWYDLDMLAKSWVGEEAYPPPGPVSSVPVPVPLSQPATTTNASSKNHDLVRVMPPSSKCKNPMKLGQNRVECFPRALRKRVRTGDVSALDRGAAQGLRQVPSRQTYGAPHEDELQQL